MMRIYTIFLLVLLSACSSFNVNKMEQNTQKIVDADLQNIKAVTLLGGEHYISFALNQHKNDFIINKSSIQKPTKKNHDQAASCLYIKEKGYDDCGGIGDEIYKKFQAADTSQLLVAGITSPLVMLIDILEFDPNFSSTKSSFGSEEVSPEMVAKVGRLVDKKIILEYQKYRKNSDTLLQFVDKYQASTANNPVLTRDLAQAYVQTNSVEKKQKIEAAMLSEKFIQINNKSVSKSHLKSLSTSGLFSSIGAKGRDYQYLINVSLKQDEGFPIKYGSYQVKANIDFMLDYTPPINGKEADKVSKTLEVILRPENHYSQNVTIALEGIPSSGRYRSVGLTILGSLASMFGRHSDGEAIKGGIPFVLNKIEPQFHKIQIKAVTE